MKKNLFVLRLLTLVAIPIYFASCSESGDDNGSTTPPDTPSNPDVTQVIPTTGGNISYENVSATFTSGTFSNASEVSITEVKNGSILGDKEESTFYTLTMPLSTNKPFTVSIKYDGTRSGNDEVVLVAHTPVSATEDTQRETAYSDIILPTTYSNGAYIAEIPTFDNEGETDNVNVTFGLARITKDEITRRAATTERITNRAVEDGDINWTKRWKEYSDDPRKEQISRDIDEAMTDAVAIIKSLGFKVKNHRIVPLIIQSKGLKEGEYGQHRQSFVSDSWNDVLLNASLLFGSTYSKKLLRRTIIHEMFHYFQSAYDNRGCFKKAKFANLTVLRIMEAGGGWIEKFMDEDRYQDGHWITNYNEVLLKTLGDDTEETAQSKGYGSAIILQWFAYKKGDKAITTLYETWRDKGAKTFEDWLRKGETATGCQYFKSYGDFVEMLARGKVVVGTEIIEDDGTVTREKYNVKQFMVYSPKSYTSDGSYTIKGEVLQYGICTDMVRLNKYSSDIKGKQITVNQKADGVITKAFLYNAKTAEVKYLDMIHSDKSLVIDDETTLKNLIDNTNPLAGYSLHFVTYQATNNLDSEPSELKITIGKPEISTSPKTLAFEAKGGTKEVTVVTNQPNFKAKANNDWLEVRKVDNLTFKVTANQNTGNARTGSVTVTALNEENKEVGTYEMQVTQEEREKGAFDFTDLKYITIEVNTKVHYTGVWDGDQNDVFVLTKFPDNFNITPTYLAESPSTQTTVTPVGNGVHIECICQTEESGEWMGVWNLTRDYQVTLDIDDVVSGKITNISAKCYWYNIHRADASVGGNVEESHNDEKLSASNIPLPDKSGVAKGDQWTNTSINCSRSEHKGWTDYKYTTISSDEYSIVVNFHK